MTSEAEMTQRIWLQDLTWEEIRDHVGTTGEPSKATVEGGKAYHEHLVARLVEVIRGFQAK
jgi:creatinine amidohydrolase/Fe(II)-dependent formamide hydrolase-like protein